MKLKDVKQLPVIRDIDDVCCYGKRNYGKIPRPQYFGVQQQPQENLVPLWNAFKAKCIQLLRDDEWPACNVLVSKYGKIRHTKYKWQSDEIIGFLREEFG